MSGRIIGGGRRRFFGFFLQRRPNAFKLQRVEEALFHEGRKIFEPGRGSWSLLCRLPAFIAHDDENAKKDQAGEDGDQEYPFKVEAEAVPST